MLPHEYGADPGDWVRRFQKRGIGTFPKAPIPICLRRASAACESAASVTVEVLAVELFRDTVTQLEPFAERMAVMKTCINACPEGLPFQTTNIAEGASFLGNRVGNCELHVGRAKEIFQLRSIVAAAHVWAAGNSGCGGVGANGSQAGSASVSGYFHQFLRWESPLPGARN